jgi:hypothetical protein
MKRAVVLGDFHCGSKVGLTPPDWQQDKLQEKLWDAFAETIDALQPIDILIVNGDLIDGKNPKSGGIDLITTDRIEQIEMAYDVILYTGAEEVAITRGTKYHTGTQENLERVIARKLSAEFGNRLFVDINGLMFDVKHFVGGSTIPHGRFTAIGRDRMWNVLWNVDAEGTQPKADVLVRSHVHYFQYCGGTNWLGIILPSLQGLGGDYGESIPSGTVDFGVVWFDIEDKENWEWDYKIYQGMQKVEPIKL